jgi:cell division protein FtsX
MKKILVIVGVILVMAVAGWFGFGYLNFKNLQNQCYQKYKNSDSVTTVYFNVSSSFSNIQSIAADIQSSQNVKSASAISADEALQNYKNAHAGDPAIEKAISELNSNPLEASIVITFSAEQDQSVLLTYLNAEAAKYKVSIDTISQGLTQSQKDGVLQQISNSPDNAYSVSYFKSCINGVMVGGVNP